MLPYSSEPFKTLPWHGKTISSFRAPGENGTNEIESFSSEWKKFNRFSEREIKSAGDQYFDIVSDTMLNSSSIVLDIGCGSGRWTRYVSDRAGFVEAIDLIHGIHHALELNKDKKNVRITQAGVDNIPFADNSFDFIFCLGVLHHLENTENALQKAVQKLKKDGHFLIYLYYKIDQSGFINQVIFYFANMVRLVVSRLPDFLKLPVCDLLAILIYLPLVGLTKLVQMISPYKNYYRHIPLYYYANKTFRIMRNDSLDRFGTQLEKRFSKQEIHTMMEKAGLENIVFSENAPFWHAVGKKR